MPRVGQGGFYLLIGLEWFNNKVIEIVGTDREFIHNCHAGSGLNQRTGRKTEPYIDVDMLVLTGLTKCLVKK